MQHHDVGVEVAEQGLHPVDLGDARKEHEDVAVVLLQCRVDGSGDARLDALPAVRWSVHDVDGMRPGPRGDDRRGTEERGQAFRRDGGRGRQQPQVVPQARTSVEQERQQQIGVEMAFVALVEHHHRRVAQLGIVLEASHEETGGHHLHTGPRRDLAVAPHRVPDGVADGFPEQLRHARGGGTGGESAWFGHDHFAREVSGQCQGDERGLAGAGWGDEHGAAAVGHGGAHVVEYGAHRQVGQHHGVEVAHGPSISGGVATSTPDGARCRSSDARHEPESIIFRRAALTAACPSVSPLRSPIP